MSNLELDEKNRRITALLKSIEELEAEVQRWKGLADLKDAKGEANRTENNNLRTNNTSLQRQISDLTIERDNALRQYHEVRRTYESILREVGELRDQLGQRAEYIANALEEAMRKGETSTYDELVEIITEVITRK